MTDLQKQRIVQMRAEGKRYNEIAEELGLTASCVKMYFKRLKEEPRRCEQCGKKLRSDLLRPTKRFCSDACRMKWWAVHPERMKEKRCFRCESCGKEFYSRRTRKYCSRICYYKSLRQDG